MKKKRAFPLLAKSLAELPHDGVVVVYGAGDGGKLVKRKLERFYGFAISAFIDSFKSGTLEGIPIIGPNRLLSDYSKNTPIIVTSQSYDTIVKKLSDAGFTVVVNAFPYVTIHLEEIRCEPTLRTPRLWATR